MNTFDSAFNTLHYLTDAIKYLEYEYGEVLPMAHYLFCEGNGKMYYLWGARLYKITETNYPGVPLSFSLEKVFVPLGGEKS